MCVLSHTVVKLAVHLPNEETVFWVKGHEKEKLNQLLNIGPVKTQLTAFFALCTVDAKARKYTYLDICEHYRFDSHMSMSRRRPYMLQVVLLFQDVDREDEKLEGASQNVHRQPTLL